MLLFPRIDNNIVKYCFVNEDLNSVAATLLLVLPTEYEGGKLGIKEDDGTEQEYNFSTLIKTSSSSQEIQREYRKVGRKLRQKRYWVPAMVATLKNID